MFYDLHFQDLLWKQSMPTLHGWVLGTVRHLSFIIALFVSTIWFILLLQAKQEIREGAPQRKVDVSSIYTTAKGPQPDGAENIDLYNLTTCSQNKVDTTRFLF